MGVCLLVSFPFKGRAAPGAQGEPGSEGTPLLLSLHQVSRSAHVSATSMTRVRHESAMSSAMEGKGLHTKSPCCLRRAGASVREALVVFDLGGLT